jgi:hypothetical protein
MTTRSTPREPWDDERLAAAFAARASMAREAAERIPIDLTARALDAVRADRGRRSLHWPRLAPALTVVALVMVAVAGSLALISSRQPTASQGIPSAGVPSPGTSNPSPSPASSPDTAEVLGLPLTTVGEAIAIRDAGIDDQEIAVHGWYSPFYPARACGRGTNGIPMPPIRMTCPDKLTWLMQYPEPLSSVTSEGVSWRGPTGPAISPDFDDLDMSWTGPIEPDRVFALVVIGHFDDRRSFACPADEIQACRDRLVVDRVVSTDGQEVPTSATDEVDGGATFTAADVVAKLRETVSGAEILSMAAVDGATGLERVEPSIGVFAQFQDQRAVWIVRLLDRVGQFGTYLVVDGADAVYKIDADSVAILVSGALPLRSPAPWPPDGSTIVELKSQVGVDRPRARVAVVDLSGSLTSVREARSSDPPFKGATDIGRVFVASSGGTQVRLLWIGTVCDGDMTVTIQRGVAAMDVDGGMRPGCDAMGVGRELVLTFSGPVDVSGIEVTYHETMLHEP